MPAIVQVLFFPFLVTATIIWIYIYNLRKKRKKKSKGDRVPHYGMMDVLREEDEFLGI